MTTAQRNAMPEDEDVTAADRLIVESPTLTGLIVARAFSPEPSLLPTKATAALTGAQCRLQRAGALRARSGRFESRLRSISSVHDAVPEVRGPLAIGLPVHASS